MSSITFRVPGLPPKKDGASSMWRKHPEVARVLALRLAAQDAAGDVLLPVDGPFHLELMVHVGPVNTQSVGDLDNMVTGVLDALQQAHPAVPWAREPLWDTPEGRAVAPDRFCVISDDVHAVKIAAEKRVGEGEPWYEVRLASMTTWQPLQP